MDSKNLDAPSSPRLTPGASGARKESGDCMMDMWTRIILKCGQLRTGQISKVGTKEKWACAPTCSYAIPVSGKTTELDEAVLDGSGPVEFQFCHNPAEYRVILEGGPFHFSFDDLVCRTHLDKRESQLEARAQDAHELWSSLTDEQRRELDENYGS